MNTLGYVARQFDVLASPRSTPPNTPTREYKIPRVSSWNTKSFLFPPQPRRSKSSPHLVPPTQPPQPPPTPEHVLPSPPPSPPRSKAAKPSIEAVIDQIFFIRVFLVVWDSLKPAWVSLLTNLRHTFALLPIPTRKGKQKEIIPELVLDSNFSLNLAGRSIVRPSSLSISVVRNNHEIATASQPSPIDTHSQSSGSRAGTPGPPAKKTPFHRPKTLVLDLDETLIHSTSRPMPYQSSGSSLLSLGIFGSRKMGPGHTVEVLLGGRSTVYHVYKRPFVDFFLRTVSRWYTLVIFTASVQEYADPVIDWLDAGRGILEHRFFRDSCTQLPNGSYTKDLSIIEDDLSRVCLVDNSPVSYSINEANGIPIEGWTHDPSDEALLDLLPVLDSLRFTSDVRRVLGLRSAGVHCWVS
ncbi:hypothetical protein D9619_000311 [Psilocybe cf. subviscida]|uniref:FCP1 homology domain-containing protein n=1 Tax=Psilocybe cf. subviscida TaxID=2480587 RepID=A0A8H5BGB6_9AGAR|nr:hypothetical protein D9619_000311 [Psilocybe cf. subviscida]